MIYSSGLSFGAFKLSITCHRSCAPVFVSVCHTSKLSPAQCACDWRAYRAHLIDAFFAPEGSEGAARGAEGGADGRVRVSVKMRCAISGFPPRFGAVTRALAASRPAHDPLRDHVGPGATVPPRRQEAAACVGRRTAPPPNSGRQRAQRGRAMEALFAPNKWKRGEAGRAATPTPRAAWQ